ncbi:MAG: methionine synthase [Chloroflexota bacterium]|nr:MAG: methionine synthase [Chloroflexota bacterium]
MATAIGSLPHVDPVEACSLVLSTLPDLPPWPQLPRRSFLENMYVQYSEGFPGVVVDTAQEKIYVDRTRDLDPALERLYLAYLENASTSWSISSSYAQGLHQFLAGSVGNPVALKGQVTGPISWGLSVTDQNRRAILYDEILAEALAKHLRLKAAWVEGVLRSICPQTIIFVDEPYMSAFGSAFVSISREQVIGLLEEVFQGIKGLKGVHCCGNTDWSVLLSTSVNILNLDAYDYAESLSLYPSDVQAFLNRDGIIAWGIVPTEAAALAGETTESLVARLEQSVGFLVDKGLPLDQILERSLITPSCGLASVSVELAEQAMRLTSHVSAAMRKKYFEETPL